jgi:hypothetical protein
MILIQKGLSRMHNRLVKRERRGESVRNHGVDEPCATGGGREVGSRSVFGTLTEAPGLKPGR